ncbi:MAG: EAL domain-containing protein [Clostridia bacterium]|nr:EAL domain-containing protein [Clostridia bacterium]
MHSLRVKLTGFTIAAIFFTILCVIVTSSLMIQTKADRDSVAMMNLIGQDARKSIEKYLESIEQSVEMMANIACDSLDSVILVDSGAAGAKAKSGEKTSEQKTRLDEYMAGYCQRLQEAFASVASYTHGVVTYYYCINPDISENEHGFFYSRVGKTGFSEQLPLDARELDPEDMAHTTWYYTTIQRGRPSWVGPYTAHYLGEMITYSYLVPIYKAGALIGVLGMDIPFETLTDQLTSIRVYETGFACLLDADGRVLYHPEAAFGSSLSFSENAADQVLQSDSSGSRLIRYERNGQQRQMSFTTLSDGMKLVVIAPVSEINASRLQLTNLILMITAVFMVLSSGILMLLMRVVTRPLQRLTSASKRLAAGDYDVEIRYDGRDEVGVLTRAFTQMSSHLKQYIDDLNRRVNTDDLTGLPNMRCFFRLAMAEKNRLLSSGKHPAMLYFNLIGLKYFNRRYGFSEGDQLIREVGEILRLHYGDQRVSRYGGDHFAAVTDEENLEEELKTVIRKCENVNGGKSVHIRAGVYLHRMGDTDVSNACDRAKYACDRLRGTYESGYCIFDDGMLRNMLNDRYIIDHLEQALEEQWIKVYFQPIIRSANGRVCDEEALSRWIDPEKGMISPAEFIPVLEGARLIYKLDLYVLDHVLLKMQAQKEAGLYLVPQSLNLSRADFDVCDIVDEVCRRVDEAGIPRDKLTIELTESMVGRDFEFMKEQIARFQNLGFKVWMDDFGSGYSSLDVLQDIHFDLIKFDMRFMQRFSEGDESKIILTEMIKMVIGLGIDTVVEGVETKEQVDFLREVGCTKMQGFYFCQAIPLEKIIERYNHGMQIGFENQEETGYYTAIGRINLYDLAAVASDGSERLGNFFETLPMAVIETDGRKELQVIRCNKSYRDFVGRTLDKKHFLPAEENAGTESINNTPFLQAVAQCREEGTRSFIHEKLPNGSTLHAFVRHVAMNPVKGIFSCVVVILGIADEQK